MNIIVCGAGQVGASIARHLADEHHNVTLIDLSAELINRLTSTHDVQGVVGHASHPDVLESAGAAQADMLIAATHSDEVNMVACQVAYSLFGVRQIEQLARLRFRKGERRALVAVDRWPNRFEAMGKREPFTRSRARDTSAAVPGPYRCSAIRRSRVNLGRLASGRKRRSGDAGLLMTMPSSSHSTPNSPSLPNPVSPPMSRSI